MRKSEVGITSHHFVIFRFKELDSPMKVIGSENSMRRFGDKKRSMQHEGGRVNWLVLVKSTVLGRRRLGIDVDSCYSEE